METIRVLVNGANGKMGRCTVQAILAHPNLSLVAATDKDDKLADAIKDSQAEVVVDFTTAEFAYGNTKTILKAKAYPVVGTSGLTDSEVAKLRTIARQSGVGGIIVPNFSLGAVLMMRYSREIARYIPNVEVVETHHEQKQDAPSGTALRTAEMIAEVRGEKKLVKEAPTDVSRELIPGARGADYQGVSIHSIRLPGHIAHQRVVFSAPGEVLTIQHDTSDRDCFMPGVCLACLKAPYLNDLVVGLELLL